MSETRRESFDRHYLLIREHRASRDAPVDSMGTGFLDYDSDPTVRRFQMLTSTLLSSQTRDEQTSAAVARLMEWGLTVEKICETTEEDLAEFLKGVRFARRKAGFLKKTATILHEQYGGDVPTTEKELTSLPGVGSKMALVVLEHGWEKCVGIPVDGHFHRVANRLGWVDTSKADQTRKALEEFIPSDRWPGLSVAIIGFGQQVCKKEPLCGECRLASTCPHYNR